MEMLMYCLAVYGVATLIVYEDGPWNLLRRFREWAGVYDGEIIGKPLAPYTDIEPVDDSNSLGKLLGCRLCTGFWVGITLLPVLVICPFLLMPFAGVGFVSFVQESNCGDR